ncbi:MAG: hypothetical protein M1837_002262 [Sclerophora amabilis]|nr:MAG: hypothetical protein M1837_002262 [Sclerophora amabilis]
MDVLHLFVKADPTQLIPTLLVAAYANASKSASKITLNLHDAESKTSGSGNPVELRRDGVDPVIGASAIVDHIVNSHPDLQKGGSLENQMLARLPNFFPLDFKTVEKSLLELNSHLILRSHVVGYSLSFADLAIWGAIRGNRVALATLKKGSMINVSRWYDYILETNSWIPTAIEELHASAKAEKDAASRTGGSYDIALKDTSQGVVTRFPPEPSGYLHIGHAKAVLLNDYFAHEKYKGTMVLRFDDTNPKKERMEYQDAIVEDLKLMGVFPDKTTYTSDYFEILAEFCVQMIRLGKAFADDSDKDTMKRQRQEFAPSPRRDASVEDNLARFEEMKAGSGEKWSIRAKISYDDPNGTLRDPVIYRCVSDAVHHRTGSKWKIYPTYDFCCPIVDSIEGITVALRTIEYRERNAQYAWFLSTLSLRQVQIFDFSRISFVRTLLSKRKLNDLIEIGAASGWDDPRFPTIRGIRRRGMTIQALREFMLKQGPSRNILNLDWTLFWATNKKYIDPIAPRHTAVLGKNAVRSTVEGLAKPSYCEEKPKHAKNLALGNRKVWYASNILLDQSDAATFAVDEEITLMDWGNAIVRSLSRDSQSPNIITHINLELHLQGNVKTTSKKVTWLAISPGPESGVPEPVPVRLVDFDFLITKDKLEENDNLRDFLTPCTELSEAAMADPDVAQLRKDDIIQFQRKGWYRVDRTSENHEPVTLFRIPSGKKDEFVNEPIS